MVDITSLKSSFKGDIVLPEDADFAKAIARWSVTAERNAAIVAFVKDAEDIGLAIKFAKENKLPIAIRGGGHNPAGASSSENGIVIDLSRYINTVRIDAEKKLGYVGGGAIWETVDKEAIKYGLATVGGTVNHTGVGGLILGGGFGWLSASYGLAIDNLVQVTIIPASGVAVTANESTNPDLFWAVKGGGSNFGVVTEFVLKLHPQRATVYAGPLVFIPPQTPKLNEVTTEWYKNAGEKEAMIQIVTVGPDGNPVIIAVVFYNGTEAEGRAAFKAFHDIGPVADLAGEVPYETVNGLQNKQAYHGQGVYFKGVSPRLPAERNMVKAHQRAIEITNSPQFGGIRPTLLFEYFPMKKINSVADDATAFHRNVSPSVLMFIAWPGETNKQLTDGKTKVELARQIGNELGDILSEGHDEFSLGYTNYDVDGEASQTQAQKAFASNYPKLQKVKKEWDPEVIFNKWFPITPA